MTGVPDFFDAAEDLEDFPGGHETALDHWQITVGNQHPQVGVDLTYETGRLRVQMIGPHGHEVGALRSFPLSLGELENLASLTLGQDAARCTLIDLVATHCGARAERPGSAATLLVLNYLVFERDVSLLNNEIALIDDDLNGTQIPWPDHLISALGQAGRSEQPPLPILEVHRDGTCRMHYSTAPPRVTDHVQPYGEKMVQFNLHTISFTEFRMLCDGFRS